MLRLRKSITGKPNYASHRHAPGQEAAIAKAIGAKPVRGSGSGNEKGDARKRGVARIECKSTIHKSFSITQEIIDKIEAAALGATEIPMIQLDMLAEDGKVRHQLAIMPLFAITELLERVATQEYSPPGNKGSKPSRDTGTFLDPPSEPDTPCPDDPRGGLRARKRK